jgi:hypothetical protein
MRLSAEGSSGKNLYNVTGKAKSTQQGDHVLLKHGNYLPPDQMKLVTASIFALAQIGSSTGSQLLLLPTGQAPIKVRELFEILNFAHGFVLCQKPIQRLCRDF